jgi:outer membrane immunogenic protein
MFSRFVGAATAALFLSAGAAAAADLPARRAPAPYVPVALPFTWTGFYVGTLTGYDFSDRQTIRNSGNTAATAATIPGVRPSTLRGSYDGTTTFGGGGGYDYQFTPGNGFVVGVAADDILTDVGKRRSSFGLGGAETNIRQKLDTFGTVRGRLGYAFDRFLVYGTGGFAFGDVTYRSSFFNAPGRVLAYNGLYTGMETGYVYGGGVEYAIPTDSFLNYFSVGKYIPFLSSAAVTVKVEYLHYDLGSRNVTVNNTGLPGFGGSYTSRFTTEGNMVRGGFTYRFSGL